ncbi:hypothetical protein TPHA_0I02040 [Tetrapisispora phaffii CBS 4417]|uniref:inositol phosphorylceramide mannosyltransferase n=1 Tax=Tetrapisispora phaffii (strain ATCC 24235 / CBS 4417 / NBRC 1672 / NRRL Y-8282 / UCD 70-5) TaxID=1071381 RepID=G8BXT0_TETPH|nr:hypothetical protein TPHA_0I02040 [Tetrapisispora phaffii CBS 4417]CCE64708.1 hypothetical protein TPHA_0I02040 [Tetrapisispora phaffii CBS 4417]
MKRELIYLFLVNFAFVVVTLYYTFDVLTLAVDDTVKDSFRDYELNPDNYRNLSNDELPSFLTPSMLNKPQLIPKIIHQTYKTNDIPEHWKEGQQRCKDLHPDYEYILWTDAMAEDFIAENYSWFLETFKNYQYPIERADAIRYFILSHFGGVYIDLDDGCQRKLDPLLTAPAFLRKTSPTGVSNDVMGSIPGHPFFLKVIESLKKYDRNWFVPYITIMSSTGPLFISMVWKQYKRSSLYNKNLNSVVKILQPADYKMHKNSFFTIAKGSSWHAGDANFIKSLAVHILACVVAGFILAFSILYSEYLFYCWLCATNRKNNKFSRLQSRYNDIEQIQIENSISSKNKFSLKRSLKKLSNLKIARKDSNLSYLPIAN